jgi:hypothetical protein
MSAWNLSIGGRSEVYIHHIDADGAYRFVARFKHARPVTNARAFAKFLQANLTPEQYFAALDAGTPPLTILESHGYISPNVRRARTLAIEAAAAEYRARVAEANAVDRWLGLV